MTETLLDLLLFWKVVPRNKKGHTIPNFTFFIFFFLLLRQKSRSFWWIINLQQALEKERKNLFGLFRNMRNKSMIKWLQRLSYSSTIYIFLRLLFQTNHFVTHLAYQTFHVLCLLNSIVTFFWFNLAETSKPYKIIKIADIILIQMDILIILQSPEVSVGLNNKNFTFEFHKHKT